MSEIYTIVSNGSVAGWACRGRRTRQDAIAEAKQQFEYARNEAQRCLDAIADGTIEVVVQRGYYAPKVIEVLR